MSDAGKFLLVQVGRHGVLLDALTVIEIAEYRSGLCGDAATAAQHHGHAVWWRDSELPFRDMRVALGLATGSLAEPVHTLAVAQEPGGQAAALLAVDGVHRILDVSREQWHWLQGVHPQLDRLFDCLLPDSETGEVWLRLRPLPAWLSLPAGVPD